MDEPTTLIPEFSSPPLSFVGAGMTNVGRVRQVNEDAILTDPSGVFWAIADGMGGHGHGDLASEIVIDHLSQMPDEGETKTLLVSLLRAANQAIQARMIELGTGQMGATVIAMKLAPSSAKIAWAGDCRGYLFRSGDLRQLTQDHTVVEELVQEGLLAPENAKNHANANVVTRAVGADETVEIDHVSVPLIAGDRLVLCSDGLTACLDHVDIRDQMNGATDPDMACRRLMTAALETGAPDNVSVIVVFAEGT
jgi:protein phosphatase